MGSSTGKPTKSNADLKPETSDNYEIGARWSKSGINIDTAVFYSDASDYIDTVPDATGTQEQYQNINSAKTWGVEMAASWKIGATGFEPYASLTWMRRQYDHNGITTFKSGTPEFFGRYGVRWAGEYNGLGLHTDVYGYTQTATDSLTTDKVTVLHCGGATTFNLTAGVSFGPEKQYSLDAGFYNISDKKYQDNTSVYEPGRYLALKLNARF